MTNKLRPDPDAYDITSYDLIYILFKEHSSFHVKYPAITKYDKSKNRHYIKGRAVRHSVSNATGQVVYSYPREHTIAFVP